MQVDFRLRFYRTTTVLVPALNGVLIKSQYAVAICETTFNVYVPGVG